MSLKKRNVLFLAFIFAILLMSFECTKPGDAGNSGSTVTDVVFLSAVQTSGTDGMADSTGLILTFDVNPETLTVDNVTVTGATKGALSGSGTSRNLAISNIAVANGATLSVMITSPSGYSMSGLPQTAVVYRLLTIGMDYQGGKIAYILQSGDPGYVSGETHGFIAATADQSTGIEWITGGSTQSTLNDGTSTALGTGQANTTAMKNQSGYTGGAAKVCDDYVNTDTGTGTYTDWYLPSQDELNKLYINRDAIGGFTSGTYWSSSEYVAVTTSAFFQLFSNGAQGYVGKGSPGLRVRAIRDF